MRRIWLLALAATAIVVFPTSALSRGAQHRTKSGNESPAASYKNGFYNAMFQSNGHRGVFGLRLANSKVSMGIVTPIPCGTVSYDPIHSFRPQRKLSASGSVTEHAPAYLKYPEERPLTGSSTFSVTFTKHGTATGYLEVSMTGEFRRKPFSCTSGKAPFTAKLRYTLAYKRV